MFKEASNSVEIPFTEEELIEYLRIAMAKIRYSVPAKLPHKKLGLSLIMWSKIHAFSISFRVTIL